MTPNGQADTQYPQPSQTSSWTTTVPNSVRNSAPVGHTSRQAADVQCLQTSDDMSHCIEACPTGGAWPGDGGWAGAVADFSMNATWRHVSADRRPVLS